MKLRGRSTQVGAAVILAALVAACGKSTSESGLKGGGKATRKLEYPVEVTSLASRQVRYTVTAPGSIEAFQQVQITARVAGAVDTVSFREGELVKKDETLVTIESDRFRVAVDQANAALAKAQASEQQAEGELARRQGAVVDHPGLIPGEEIATYQTAVATGKADVEAANQALRVAELNLRDSHVRTPIAGVVQTRTVQDGQYLQPGAVLATILQRDPLLLRFQVTEQDAPRLKAGMTATLRLEESAHTYTANITLVAEAADATTRLVPVTGEIDDKEHRYWLRPGAFCEVDVPVGDARRAIVVPTLAVQPTENGNTVYVVQGTQAKARAVTLGMHTSDGNVEVTRGLAAGDLLVTRGVELLSDGAPVKITARSMQATDASAPAVKANDAAGAASVAVANEPAAAPGATDPLAEGHTGKHRTGGGSP